MLHELDEITFIRPWILQNQANKRYLKRDVYCREKSLSFDGKHSVDDC